MDVPCLSLSQQFGFKKKHGTIEQAHNLVNKINNDLESKRSAQQPSST
jgi:hypothetical protein